MKSRNFRTFEADGEMCSFNTEGFNRVIDQYRCKLKDEGNPYLIKDISDDIASKLNISVEAFANWRKGYNGPSDIERIKEISAVLQCDYRDLLRIVGGTNNMIKKEVDLNIAATEKEALQSVICDLLEIVESFGKTNMFNVIPVGNKDDDKKEQSDIDFEKWFYDIRLKMRMNSFLFSSENNKKLERLFFETKSFVDYTSYCTVERWKSICKGFELQYDLEEAAADEFLDIEGFIADFADEEMKKYLDNEFFDYYQGCYHGDNAIQIIGYKIGAWYMEVVRNDFPELFVD